jgi:eukaryotic-like serine/threonine-protein kinase
MSVGIPFGNYRLTRRLARGGMAEVFLATQRGPEGFERTVAVKRILPHLADLEQFVEMFMDEARLAAQLSHPNIAHIYEFGRVDDSYFIAMEYIDGIDLSVIVMEGLTHLLPLEHAARIIADVCAALHYAHSLMGKDGRPVGLVHRDISPQNILVSFAGAVKVVDFGIAKAADHIERTRPGVVRGKFTYMSPEQVDGKPLDGRADLFCAGIVLYELCTGQPLFPRTNAMEAMRRARAADVPPPQRNGEPLPPQLDRILRRALARRREDRYRNAAEMQMDLEAYLRTASQISNSIILADYFGANYRRLRPPDEPIDGPGGKQGTVAARPGTAMAKPAGTAIAKPAPPPIPNAVVSDPSQQLLAPEEEGTVRVSGTSRAQLGEDEKTLVVDESRVSAQDLEHPTFDTNRPERVSGIIEPRQPESGPYLPIESGQVLADDPGLDESELALSPTLDGGPVTDGVLQISSTDVPLRRPSGDPTADDSSMSTVEPQVPLHSARTALLAGTTLRVRSYGRRALIIGLVICVALVGVVVGYWLSNPGEPSGETRPSTGHAPLRPDALMVITRPLDRGPADGPRLATLHIQTKPEGASITIDGIDVTGTTPLTQTLFAGGHTVVASYPGFQDRAEKIRLAPGQDANLTFTLRRLSDEQVVALKKNDKKIKKTKVRTKRHGDDPKTSYGYISITTFPWSTVWLEERKVGVTPFANVKVPAGTYKLRFMNAKGHNIYKSVTVKPGQLTKLSFRLPG